MIAGEKFGGFVENIEFLIWNIDNNLTTKMNLIPELDRSIEHFQQM